MNEKMDQNERNEEGTQIWNLDVYEMPIAENGKNQTIRLGYRVGKTRV